MPASTVRMYHDGGMQTSPLSRSPHRAPHGALRRVLGITLAVVVATGVAACGGGGSASDGSTATTASKGDEAVTTSEGTGGGAPTESTVEGAKVRIVNLYVPAEGEPGAVEVLAGYTAAEDAQPAATVPFGEAGDYFAPPATSDGRSLFSLYPEGKTSDDDRLMQVDQTIVEGDQVTILLTAGETMEGARTGSTQVFFEQTGPSSNGAATEPAPGDKGLLLGNASAIENLGGDTDGFTFGTPGSGCLEDEDESSTLVGGTSTLRYPVEPGAVNLAAYAFDDNDCTGPPEVGPATTDLEAGDSAYAFVYSANGTDLEFLLVPIET
ncbi:MAG: hypothetical protein JWO77_162 [Ilumatobacteraceae bacterium]|nr:hypothetical protein [Ilumatobacteraceae bacterium]